MLRGSAAEIALAAAAVPTAADLSPPRPRSKSRPAADSAEGADPTPRSRSGSGAAPPDVAAPMSKSMLSGAAGSSGGRGLVVKAGIYVAVVVLDAGICGVALNLWGGACPGCPPYRALDGT